MTSLLKIPDVCSLLVNGLRYTGWKSVSFERSMEAVAGRFDVGLSEVPDVARRLFAMIRIKSGDRVTFLVNATPVLNGYIDETSRSIDGTSHSLRIAGRDLTGELVDCSALAVPGTFNNVLLEDIARDIAAPFGVGVSVRTTTGGPIKKFVIQRGESAFAAIERAARSKQVLLTTDGTGMLVITRPGSVPAPDILKEGVNVLSAGFTQNNKDRFAKYHVFGQQSGAGGRAGTGVRATVPDHELEYGGLKITQIAGVRPRYRPLVIIAEGQVDLDSAFKRAEWETAVRRARSESLEVTVPGWRTAAGMIWDTNRLVPVDIPSLGVTGRYLIAGLRFEKGDSGTLTRLTLRRRGSFAPQPL